MSYGSVQIPLRRSVCFWKSFARPQLSSTLKWFCSDEPYPELPRSVSCLKNITV